MRYKQISRFWVRQKIVGEDGAVAHLWLNHFIDGQRRTLAQVTVRGVLIGIGRRCTARFAVELGGVRITTTLDDLSCQIGEERLRPFSSVKQAELAFRLCAD